MDKYTIAIDHCITKPSFWLSSPRLPVFGRSLEDALSRARTSIGYRLGTGRRDDVAVNLGYPQAPARSA